MSLRFRERIPFEDQFGFAVTGDFPHSGPATPVDHAARRVDHGEALPEDDQVRRVRPLVVGPHVEPRHVDSQTRTKASASLSIRCSGGHGGVSPASPSTTSRSA